jgi:hypothetical protein
MRYKRVSYYETQRVVKPTLYRHEPGLGSHRLTGYFLSI